MKSSVIILSLVLAAFSFSCSNEQLAAVVDARQPLVAVTVRDGAPMVLIANCGSSFEQGVTVELLREGSTAGNSAATPIGSFFDADINVRDGVSEIDLGPALTASGISVSNLSSDQGVSLAFDLDSDYLVRSLIPAYGSWPAYPQAAVLDPADEDTFTRDIQANPITCVRR